jgi:hypothetical protein
LLARARERTILTTIKATIIGRRLELDVPADWPDGTEVAIHPLGQDANAADDKLTPEEIARTLAAMDQIVPIMTEAEQASWEAELRARKEREKAQFTEHAEKLRKLWE